MQTVTDPILILGGGVNGAALARELLLNRVPVVLVDIADVASGTTAYSSRLIHGGLRYLEFGELDLVRESLDERGRLLETAPQFVRPLRLDIPVERRTGGWLAAIMRMVARHSATRTPQRGKWLVQTGLWMYDRYARDRRLPKHSVSRVGDGRGVAVDPNRFRWICSYSDAQMRYPERFVLALLEDARRLSAEGGVDFWLLNYHEACRDGRQVTIRAVNRNDAAPTLEFTPSAIINATGAWVDDTLTRLKVPCQRLMGGTKGTHFVTYDDALRQAIGDRGLYIEAEDGRPVFVLPLGEGVLVGTTDEPFTGDPRDAVATDDELDYLVGVVQSAFPQVGITRSTIDWHYSGVRPLPYVGAATPAGITRRHRLEEHADCPLPFFSIIGGKLTTQRALAEETTAAVLGRLGQQPQATSRARLVPGAEGYPTDEATCRDNLDRLASEIGLSREQFDAVWPLYGTRIRDVMAGADSAREQNVPDTNLPAALVHWAIEHEWAQTLDDLVERRLMLLYAPQLSTASLRFLAESLVVAGKLAAGDVDSAVAATTERLHTRFGKLLGPRLSATPSS